LVIDDAAAERLAERLHPGDKVPPELFGDYFALVEAIDAADLVEAQTRLDDVLGSPPSHSKPIAVDLYSSSTSAAEAGRMDRHFDFSDGVGCRLKPLDPTAEGPARERVNRALGMLRSMAPNTWAEMNEIVTRFVLVGATQGQEGYTFDGASSLEQWGTVLINVGVSKSDLELCETLAHESAHCSLFAMSPRTFFVRNPDDDRYVSPLRYDPRPLDGIYHATFVLGRMHYAINEMQQSGLLDEASVAEAGHLLERSKDNFDDGYAVLAERADFTEDGRVLMEATYRYMASAGDIPVDRSPAPEVLREG
jgi:hypothetical protein